MRSDEHDREHEELRNQIVSLAYAIYGNPEIPEDKGMRGKLDEIHGMIVEAKGFGKISKWALTTVVLVGAAVAAIFEMIKRFK